MSNAQFTLTDLVRILREGAGADEHAEPEAGFLDTSFTDLGYDSLALLETGGRIEREFAVSLDDTAISDAATPRALIDTVNQQLTASQSAA